VRVRLQPLRYLLESAASPMRLAMTRRSRSMRRPNSGEVCGARGESTSAAEAALPAAEHFCED